MTIDELVNLILDNLSKARDNELDDKMHSPMAAAALEAQIRLADVIAGADFDARQAKNDLECVLGERAIEIRDSSSDKKITDATMTSLLGKDTKVKEAKQKYADAEKTAKKWNLVNATLSNAHVFFRGLDKITKGVI